MVKAIIPQRSTIKSEANVREIGVSKDRGGKLPKLAVFDYSSREFKKGKVSESTWPGKGSQYLVYHDSLTLLFLQWLFNYIIFTSKKCTSIELYFICSAFCGLSVIVSLRAPFRYQKYEDKNSNSKITFSVF